MSQNLQFQEYSHEYLENNNKFCNFNHILALYRIDIHCAIESTNLPLEKWRDCIVCRISTSLKITLLYFRPDLITFITSCTTLTFIYQTFSIYYELSLTFLTNKREQETHFLYFCFQNPYCIANAHRRVHCTISLAFVCSYRSIRGRERQRRNENLDRWSS
jgi:hypothetical protein